MVNRITVSQLNTLFTDLFGIEEPNRVGAVRIQAGFIEISMINGGPSPDITCETPGPVEMEPITITTVRIPITLDDPEPDAS